MKSFTNSESGTPASAGNRAALSAGFTLIEMMVAIAMLAVLLGIAVPDLRNYLINSRLTAQINELVADISLARSEAATRSARITVCTSADLETCSGEGDAWEGGRIVFVDTNANGDREATEQILKTTSSLGGSRTLIASGFSNTNSISFRPYGGLQPATGGSFLLCDPATDTGRSVVVAATGRPIASKVTCP
ncbi:MAG: prepilin-type N-terminal cleavage/methylation domain-containing protein [Thermomicrobiales bacterium]|nr:MAG: prepilin-type N-terminal cleavage/methylation domain-containing protein [Thermomicrobiales bacterium]